MKADLDGFRSVLRLPAVVVDSGLLFCQALLAAATQTVFWLVAARLQSPDVVGVAGTLISATISLGFFSLLGLNYSLVRLLPTSKTPGSDVASSLLIVSLVGFVLAGGYALVASHISSSLAFLGHSPLTVLAFAVLVAGSAGNMLTDSAFLIMRGVSTNVLINAVAGAVRCLLPLALAGAAAFGLFASAGIAMTLAGLLSVWAILRRLPRPDRWLRLPRGLTGVVRFAGAGYATSVLDMIPLLVLPLLVVGMRGAAAGGVFFVCFQVATLLNALVLAVTMSMFAEGSRHPEEAAAVGRRGALILAGSVTAAVALVIPASHLVLSVFGAQYADEGRTTLIILAVGTFGVALNNWALSWLRIAHLLRATVVTQAVTCVTILGLAFAGSAHGLGWVAAAWGVGQLAGGLVGVATVRRASTAGREMRRRAAEPALEMSGSAGPGTAP